MARQRRVSLIGSTLMLACVSVSAQAPPSCTAPPQPPTGVTSALGRDRFAAILTLRWRVLPAAMSSILGYVVEAGSRPGQSDVGSTPLPSVEVPFSMPVANGTYYVRVKAVNRCGESAPSSEVRINVTGSRPPGVPNPAVILASVRGTSEQLGGDAFVRVVGRVRNGWMAAPVALVEVQASYEGTRGGLDIAQRTFVTGGTGVLTRSRLPTDTVLVPGGSGCFVLFTRFGKPSVTGLEITIAHSGLPANALADHLEVEDGALVPDAFGNLLVSGRVVNRTDTPVGDPELWVEASDQSGRVLDCVGRGQVASLLPFAGALFRNATEAPYAATRAVRWWATSFRLAEGGGVVASVDKAYGDAERELSQLIQSSDPEAPNEVAMARDALRRVARRLDEVGSGAPHSSDTPEEPPRRGAWAR